MQMSKYGLLALLVLTFPLQLASQVPQSKGKPGGPTSAPYSQPNKIAVPAEAPQAKTSSNPYQNTVEALEVRRQYIDPILKQHWQKPIHCQKLIDDETAFSELKEILKRNESVESSVENIVGFQTRDMDSYETMQRISPELEKQIQERSEGRIVLWHPTRSTIKTLAEFWEKYPCSESGILALFQIMKNVGHYEGSFATVILDGTTLYPYRDFTMKLGDYIIDNYPECWETEIIKKGKTMDYNNRYDEKNIVAIEKWIGYVENHNVLSNKYYKFSKNTAHPEDNFIIFNYGQVSDIYLNRCDEISQEATNKKGNIAASSIDEAVQMYTKYYELWEGAKDKYPKYYEENKRGGLFRNERQKKKCYIFIEQYAPDKVRHDPILISPNP